MCAVLCVLQTIQKMFKTEAVKKYIDSKFVFYFLLILFSYSYLLNLGGDPSYLKRLGDWSDEGYWLQNPINKIRYGNFLTDDQSQSFFGAPLYNLIILIQFKLFGISLFNARIISIISLLSIAVLIYKFLRKFGFTKNKALLFSLIFLIIYDNRIYFQWSTPINIEIFFQLLLVYYISFNELKHNDKILITGICFLLCYFSKATSILLIPYLFFLITLENYKNLVDLIKKLILFSIVSVVPLLATFIYFFNIYNKKFVSYNQLTKVTTHPSIGNLFNNISNIFQNSKLVLLQTFKFPNSTFIIVIIIVFLVSWLKKNICNFDKNKLAVLLSSKDRAIVIVGLFLIFYIIALIFIGSLGYDRRQINFIVFFYIIFVYSLEKLNFSTEIIHTKRFILLTFITLFLFQTKQLIQALDLNLAISNFPNFKFLSLLLLLLVYLVLNIFYYKNKEALLGLFVGINIVFHFYFNRNTNSINFASSKLSQEYNKAQIIGSNAHHLSIESNLYPIWWMDSNINPLYPHWNQNLSVIDTNKLLILSVDDVDNNYGLFTKPMLDKKYKLIKSDSIRLYPSFFEKKISLVNNHIYTFKYQSYE